MVEKYKAISHKQTSFMPKINTSDMNNGLMGNLRELAKTLCPPLHCCYNCAAIQAKADQLSILKMKQFLFISTLGK